MRSLVVAGLAVATLAHAQPGPTWTLWEVVGDGVTTRARQQDLDQRTCERARDVESLQHHSEAVETRRGQLALIPDALGAERPEGAPIPEPPATRTPVTRYHCLKADEEPVSAHLATGKTKEAECLTVRAPDGAEITRCSAGRRVDRE